jgi:putative thioredoxin
MEPIVGTAAAPAADVVKDSDTNNFMADVIDASQEVPVIVDFWAPWCGPCKQLGPMIEKIVREAKGKVKLVKINIDENQVLAQQMRIQSIPAVYAFHQGQPVDGFAGALPESHLKQFVERLAALAGDGGGGSPVEQALEHAAAALDAHDLGQASALYSQVLAQEPENAKAIAGLARCYLAAGDMERARQTLDAAPESAAEDSDLQAARSAVELAEQAARAAGQLGALKIKVEQDPNDHASRLELATALHATGDTEAAIDHLLEIVRRNRAWNDEAARKQLLKFFEALGPTHELTVSGRRRLSSLLFS